MFKEPTATLALIEALFELIFRVFLAAAALPPQPKIPGK